MSRLSLAPTKNSLNQHRMCHQTKRLRHTDTENTHAQLKSQHYWFLLLLGCGSQFELCVGNVLKLFSNGCMLIFSNPPELQEILQGKQP